MSQTTLEERVELLEKQVAELKSLTRLQPGRSDWRSTIGMFSGDLVMKEIQEEGLKIRQADREQAKHDYS